MVFSNLRNGNLVYILYKDNVPKLEIGKIINITPPIPKYGNTGVYNPELVLDMLVNVNNNTTNFLKISANTEVADFGNNIVIASNKDAINNEIQVMKLHSLDIINSILLHKDIVKGCDTILVLLNPEKQRLELENKALREELNSLKEMMLQLIALKK